MVECDIITLVVKLITARLLLVRKYLVHTIAVCVKAYYSSQILKRYLKRLIHSCYHQQEHKERQHRYLTLYKKRASHNSHSSNTEL